MADSNSLEFAYMTIGQASSYLDINRGTVRRWIQCGKLKGQRIGKIVLILREDVQSVATQRKIELQ